MSILCRTTLYAGLLFAVVTALPVAAQQSQHEHADQQQQQTQQGGMMGMHDPAMQRMQQNMGMPMSGDPDVDFARMMIPHHQGAVDMARSELEHGKDAQLRQMA
jgi:uncharacterized protein (DUF305 family)